MSTGRPWPAAARVAILPWSPQAARRRQDGMPRRKFALLALSVFLAACGGTAAPSKPSQPAPASTAGSAPAVSPAASPKRLTRVHFRLDWLLGDYEAPTVVAKTNGYYRAAGLDVTIAQGKGSSSTAEAVANGSDDFGLADAATAALLISKGLPVKVIAGFIQKTPDSFVVHTPAEKITSPKQLAGRTFIDSAGSATTHLLPAILKQGGLTMNSIKLDTVSPAAKTATFAKTPGAVVLDYYPDDYVKIKKLVPQATYTSFADFGVNPLSVSLITNLNMIRNHPGEVRAFVAAAVKGYEFTLKHPDATVKAGLAAFPHAVVSDEAMKGVLTMLHTPASKGKPIGWMAKSDWRSTIDLMHRYGNMKTVKPLADDYTNAFLPQSQP